MTAPDALQILGLRSPDLPLIVVSGTWTRPCVTSLRLGAADYLLKDRLSRLGPAIEHALRRRELRPGRRKAERRAARRCQLLQDLVEEWTPPTPSC